MQWLYSDWLKIFTLQSQPISAGRNENQLRSRDVIFLSLTTPASTDFPSLVCLFASVIETLRLEHEDDYVLSTFWARSEHAHLENFRPTNLKREFSAENSYS